MSNGKRTKPSRQATLERTLKTVLRVGEFLGAVVATADGLPLAMAGGGADTELMAGVAAWLKDFAERTPATLDEIVGRDRQGTRLVSRYFNVGNDQLLLAVSVPPRRSHRHLTNSAIREIQQVWET